MARSREWYVENGKRVAASRPKSFWREMGRLGGRSTKLTRWVPLLEQWQTLGPRDALRAAYRAGYHAGFQRKIAVAHGATNEQRLQSQVNHDQRT